MYSLILFLFTCLQIRSIHLRDYKTASEKGCACERFKCLWIVHRASVFAGNIMIGRLKAMLSKKKLYLACDVSHLLIIPVDGIILLQENSTVSIEHVPSK
jgi:hypothetical protein